MDFSALHDALVKAGYSDDTADAKIAHDVLLKAVYDAGFHDNVTVKGGVVMSGLTNVVRLATMDMDVDFLHYSLANDSIRRATSAGLIARTDPDHPNSPRQKYALSPKMRQTAD